MRQTYGSKECENITCRIVFEKKKKNQKYHSDACRLEQNARSKSFLRVMCPHCNKELKAILKVEKIDQ